MGLGTTVAFLAFGRLFLFLVQQAGWLRPLWKRHPLLQELHDCDFCLGTWVYGFLAWAWQVNVVPFRYIPILSELGTGAAAALLMQVVRLGWESRFGTIIVSGGSHAVLGREPTGDGEEPTEGADSDLR